MKVISNFYFLENEYIELANLAQLGERNCYSAPSTTLSKKRILTEELAKLLLAIEQLKDTYDNKRQDIKM